MWADMDRYIKQIKRGTTIGHTIVTDFELPICFLL